MIGEERKTGNCTVVPDTGKAVVFVDIPGVAGIVGRYVVGVLSSLEISF